MTTVTHANPEDRAEWEALYYGYAEFYKVPMNPEILDTVWGWIHDESKPFWCLLAKNDSGKAIGLMHFREMASPLRGKHVGFLDDLFVSPDARSQGAVSALFNQLKAERDERSWPTVRWITADDNYRARAVYDTLSLRTGWITYQMDA